MSPVPAAAPAERRKQALQIFRAALDAAGPQLAVAKHIKFDGATLTAASRRYRLSSFDRIQVIGAGKASAAMAAALEHVLGRRISGGFINVPGGDRVRLRRITLNPSGHPMPDQRGLLGARKIEEIASNAGERDLLLCVISGGASALLADPAPPVTLAALRATTKQMLACGATIQELNTVRKHISRLKGGQLARIAAPASIVALILSDVVGDDLNVIGSGPTVPDPTTFSHAARVFEKYRLQMHPAVKKRIEDGLAGRIRDTPKPGDSLFSRVANVIVGNNRAAIDAAARRATELGYHPLVLSTFVEGETRDIAHMHAAIVKEIFSSGRPARPPVCILSGGETTVTISSVAISRDTVSQKNPGSGKRRGLAGGDGKGGRNQEFVLAAALALEDFDAAKSCAPSSPCCFTILSAGTDGIDGPTDAAGALADERTIGEADRLRLDARGSLDSHNSYGFWERLNGLVHTGPTGTNVMDIRIILVPPSRP